MALAQFFFLPLQWMLSGWFFIAQRSKACFCFPDSGFWDAPLNKSFACNMQMNVSANFVFEWSICPRYVTWSFWTAGFFGAWLHIFSSGFRCCSTRVWSKPEDLHVVSFKKSTKYDKLAVPLHSKGRVHYKLTWSDPAPPDCRQNLNSNFPLLGIFWSGSCNFPFVNDSLVNDTQQNLSFASWFGLIGTTKRQNQTLSQWEFVRLSRKSSAALQDSGVERERAVRQSYWVCSLVLHQHSHIR